MFAPTVPEYQIFHCINPSSEHEGGQTVFSNTRLALDFVPQQKKETWAKVKGTYLRKVALFHRKAVSPLVEKHPYRDYSVIRYSEDRKSKTERLINPVRCKLSGLNTEELNKIQTEITAALYDPRCLLSHCWQKGDTLIADNLTLLHGRTSFTSRSQRHLRRISVIGHHHVKNKNLVY